MKKLLFILTVLLLVTSCKKDDTQTTTTPTVVNTTVSGKCKCQLIKTTSLDPGVFVTQTTNVKVDTNYLYFEAKGAVAQCASAAFDSGIIIQTTSIVP